MLQRQFTPMIDTHSATWRHIEAALTDELTRLSRQIEATHLNEAETFILRGDIRRIRAVLSMPEKIRQTNE